MNYQLLQAVEAHALKNYSKDGWDIWIEAMDNTEKSEILKGARTVKGAIKKARAEVKPCADYRAEVQATEW